MLREEGVVGNGRLRMTRIAPGLRKTGHRPQDHQGLGVTIPPSLLLRADQVIG
jgi:hypothetical protein